MLLETFIVGRSPALRGRCRPVKVSLFDLLGFNDENWFVHVLVRALAAEDFKVWPDFSDLMLALAVVLRSSVDFFQAANHAVDDQSDVLAHVRFVSESCLTRKLRVFINQRLPQLSQSVVARPDLHIGLRAVLDGQAPREAFEDVLGVVGASERRCQIQDDLIVSVIGVF